MKEINREQAALTLQQKSILSRAWKTSKTPALAYKFTRSEGFMCPTILIGEKVHIMEERGEAVMCTLAMLERSQFTDAEAAALNEVSTIG